MIRGGGGVLRGERVGNRKRKEGIGGDVDLS